MTQQEKDKIIKLLDERLPPFRKFGRAINANSILSVNEQDILYDTVKSYSEEEISYIEAIQRVVDIINRHPEVRDFDKAYNNAGTPLVGIEMPFLLKQVLLSKGIQLKYTECLFVFCFLMKWGAFCVNLMLYLSKLKVLRYKLIV